MIILKGFVKNFDKEIEHKVNTLNDFIACMNEYSFDTKIEFMTNVELNLLFTSLTRSNVEYFDVQNFIENAPNEKIFESRAKLHNAFKKRGCKNIVDIALIDSIQSIEMIYDKETDEHKTKITFK